jgi:hypothetical protein
MTKGDPMLHHTQGSTRSFLAALAVCAGALFLSAACTESPPVPTQPDGALYASTTAYGLENDPSVPDVHQALGIGKIVRIGVPVKAPGRP